MDIKAAIKRAIENGEVLKVRYHGGSHPGVAREIAPQNIISDELIHAWCYFTNETKTFSFAKLELLDPTTDVKAGDWFNVPPASAPIPNYQSLDDVMKKHKQEFESEGWHIERKDDSVSLHRVRKNGTPLKSSDVSLDFTEFASEAVYDPITEQVNEVVTGKRTRPWTVRGKNETTKTTKTLDAAVAVFLEWATKLAPNRQSK